MGSLARQLRRQKKPLPRETKAVATLPTTEDQGRFIHAVRSGIQITYGDQPGLCGQTAMTALLVAQELWKREYILQSGSVAFRCPSGGWGILDGIPGTNLYHCWLARQEGKRIEIADLNACDYPLLLANEPDRPILPPDLDAIWCWGDELPTWLSFRTSVEVRRTVVARLNQEKDQLTQAANYAVFLYRQERRQTEKLAQLI